MCTNKNSKSTGGGEEHQSKKYTIVKQLKESTNNHQATIHAQAEQPHFKCTSCKTVKYLLFMSCCYSLLMLYLELEK